MSKVIKFKQINPQGKQKKESIIMFHGWGSTIDSQVEFGEELSKLGFTIFIPEILYHDTRQALSNHFEKQILQKYFWETIFYSIDEQNQIMNDLNLKNEHTILLGSSMGGFIASGIFFSTNNFAGLININGSSSFIHSEMIFRELDLRPTLNDEEMKRFKKYDPIYSNVRVKNPIIFSHGKEDQVILISGQKNFITHFKNTNVENQITFHTYKDVNHTVTIDMKNDIINWLSMAF